MAWVKVGENLVRYNGGTIYLRAKVAGKIERHSLKTSDLKLAKIKRDTKLAELRRGAALAKNDQPATMGDAIDRLEAQTVRPHLKESSRNLYRTLCRRLRESIKTALPVAKWTDAAASAWWLDLTGRLKPRSANQILRMARLLTKSLVATGAVQTDPLAAIKPMRVVKRELVLPSRQQLEAMLDEIRGRDHPTAKLRGNALAFLAYSGCRIGELPHIKWEDIRGDWLIIDGGEEGTKSRKSRQIPISPALRGVLDSLRHHGCTGPIFPLYRPDETLTNACKAAGLPHMTLHTLRHWFTSWCIENGIEIPTIARWLGHQDGGALLMRTYGHLRDQHSLEQAKRLK